MKHLILCCLLFLTTAAVAQEKSNIIFRGKITDALTGEPLQGAYILLLQSKLATTTDSAGNFSIPNLPAGHTILEVTHYGYKTIVEHLDLTTGETRNFRMEPAIIMNEGVTITAVGGITSIRKAPIPITRVNKQDLLITPSTNIIDALTREPGISQVATGPAISKPVIRGLGFNRLVVINDGVRQEGQQWGEEHGIEIDENSVSRVEVVKGPASLIYGSDALAGVINIITTTPAPLNTLRGNILTGYATNNRQRTLYGNFGGNHHGFNWNAWGDLKDAADYKNAFDGRVYNSRFKEGNAGGYIGLNGSWGYSHFIVSRFNQKVGLIEGARDASGAFVKDLPGGGTAVVSPAEFLERDPRVPYQHINHLKYISENSFALGGGRLAVNLGWQRNKRQEFGEADHADEANLFFNLKTFNYNATYHLADRNGWTTSMGASGMAQTNSNLGEEVLIPEYKIFDVGAFAHTQKTVGHTTLSGGLRYDKRDLESHELQEGGVTKFEAFEKKFYNFSASAGISYVPSSRMLMKFNVARGFRAPSMPELASNGAHEGTNRYEYGNRDLKSETSWQTDASLELNSDHVLFAVSGFYNHINNFIFYNKLRGRNGSDSLVFDGGDFIPAFKFSQQGANLAGVEILTDVHPHPLDWFHWQNRFSVVRASFTEEVDGTRNVPLIPAGRWVSEFRAELFRKAKAVRNLTFHLEMDRNFAQHRPFTAFDTETETPGYTLFNASLSANISSRGKTLFSVYLMGANLGDVAYQTHLSRLKYTDENLQTGRTGVFNMGRNFVFRVNVPLSFSTN